MPQIVLIIQTDAYAFFLKEKKGIPGDEYFR
jgi:hypothetical protein